MSIPLGIVRERLRTCLLLYLIRRWLLLSQLKSHFAQLSFVAVEKHKVLTGRLLVALNTTTSKNHRTRRADTR